MKAGPTAVIDLQFLSQMTEKEKTSLYKQIELCHSNNFKAEAPLNLVVSSLTEAFVQTLQKSNASNWGIALESGSYWELFAPEKLVYLTGDSEVTLEEVRTDEVYIIGGLVDHNRLKLITFNRATEQGIRTRRLPINVSLKTSAILTVNQVFEILLRVQNKESWEEAVEHSIPRRKVQ